MDSIEEYFEEAVNLINQEIANCDSQEDLLQRELEDVLVEVDTPDSSDDEDIRQVRLHREQNEIVREFKNAVLTVDYQPTELCSFLELYENPEYRRKMLKKIKKVKRTVKRADVYRVLNDPRYFAELRRIQNTYPSHGGRAMLNELIAIFVTLYYDEN
jgi:integrase